MKLIKKLLRALGIAYKCYKGQPVREDTRPIEEIPFEERLAQVKANRIARAEAEEKARAANPVISRDDFYVPRRYRVKPQNKPVYVRAHYRNRPKGK